MPIKITDTKLKAAEAELDAAHEKAALPKLAQIKRLATYRLEQNPNDPDAEAALQILQNGLDAFLKAVDEARGNTATTTTADKAPEFLDLIDENGNNAGRVKADNKGGIDHYKDVEKYTEVWENGHLVALKKPQAIAKPADPDTMLPIMDKGVKKGEVKLSEAEKPESPYEVITEKGVPHHAIKKPAWKLGRR